MKTRQSGFSIVEILLIITVVSMIGGLGYYVYQNGKSTSDSSAQIDKQINTAGEDNTENNTEISKYNNNELGLEFEYPSAWGVVKPEKISTKKGSQYVLSFDKKVDVKVDIVTSDYELLQLDGTNGSRANFVNTEKEITNADKERQAGNKAYSSTIIDSTNTTLLYADYDCLDGGYFIHGLAKLTKKWAGFIIDYSNNSVDGCDTSVSITKILDENIKNQINSVIKSVKEL